MLCSLAATQGGLQITTPQRKIHQKEKINFTETREEFCIPIPPQNAKTQASGLPHN